MKKGGYVLANCRICASEKLLPVISLGSMPIPNGFLTKNDLKKKEQTFPLEVSRCTECGLVQLSFIVNPKVMFGNYLYIPSASHTRITNFSTIARETSELVGFGEKDLVVDIGSNDGSLLTAYKNLGTQVLGVDPAENLVTIARLNGIPTELGFFSPTIAKMIVLKYKKAKVITATNVFAHIGDLQTFMKSIEILLDDSGIFMAQFPYLLDLIQQNQFDTIYHEHLSYFSLKPLLKLTEQTSLEICNIIRDPLDGGSLKVFWKKKRNNHITTHDENINAIQKIEDSSELYSEKTYKKFTIRIEKLKKEVVKALQAIKKKNKIVVGYGAAAKGNVLLHYFNLSTATINYVVDSTPYKQGLYTPGSHIPIFSEARISEEFPDYILILAWNFKDEIIQKNSAYLAQGGKFMVAIPSLQMVE